MTLVSRPALGAVECFTPSGFVSMPRSPRPGKEQFCEGDTPGRWKQEQSFPWPSPFVPTGPNATKFGGAGGFFFPDLAAPNNGKTFLQVLDTGGGGLVGLARISVATVLNIASGKVPETVLTIQQVKDYWTDAQDLSIEFMPGFFVDIDYLIAYYHSLVTSPD
jgi:hypothetical protein